MASIIPSYEYDIFISYRQKDNKYDGWVTEFVNNLRKELEATFKEDISIYFDENPHDGLLETHDVDESLKGKLKCLIFIPIISQTYCDPKSFAWTNEFLVFKQLASEDQFGLKVKLMNGNVASRILPIKIHDVDAEDRVNLESILEGTFRAIEFIYNEPGVNRPLKPSDNKADNYNKTDYRNQVNKVANAIKEIIRSFKPAVKPVVKLNYESKSPVFIDRRMVALITIFTLSISSLIIFFFSRFFSETSDGSIEKSIAVLPFTDLSPEQDQDWFSDGLSEEVINALERIVDFKVIARTSSFAFKGKNISIARMADSLNVNYVVEGSVKKSGSSLRIIARLVKAKEGTTVWSHIYDRELKDFFSIQEDIAQSIARTFNILLNEEQLEMMKAHGTTNIEAYLYYLKGKEAFNNAHLVGDDRVLWIAYEYFKNATTLDPEFSYCYHFMADAFTHFLGYDTNGASVDTLSRVNAYKLMHQCYDKAIRYATDSTLRNYYRLEKTILSDDWRGLVEVMTNFVNDPNALKVVKSTNITASVNAFTHLNLGKKLYEFSLDALETDPLNILHWEHLMIGALSAGLSTEADNYYGRLISKWGASYGVMDFFHLIFGRYDDVVKNNQFPAFTAIALAKLNRQDEALLIVNQMDKDSFYQFLFIWVYHELQQFQKADALTQQIDSKPYGFIPLMMLTTFAMTDFESVINLEYAPNYAARLREANIVLPSKNQ